MLYFIILKAYKSLSWFILEFTAKSGVPGSDLSSNESNR